MLNMLELVVDQRVHWVFAVFLAVALQFAHAFLLLSCFNYRGLIGSFFDYMTGLVVSCDFSKESQHPKTEMPRQALW